MVKGLIGIFWIKDDGELILDTCPYDKGGELIGAWANHSGHYPFWEEYVRERGLTVDYVHYPRGRVVFNVRTKKFKIMSSKAVLGDDRIMKKVARAFNLKKYIAEADEHYENAVW